MGIRAWSLFTIDDFPEDDVINTDPQEDLKWTPLRTIITRTGSLWSNEFSIYQCEHYTRVKFRGTPYVNQRQVDEVTEKHIFNAYVPNTNDYMLIQYAKIIAGEMANRLREHLPSINILRPELDLKVLLSDFKALYGSYFRDIRVPHLRSSALFGPEVDENEFFQQFQRLGKLSAIIVEVEHNGEIHKIIISRGYTVGFYRPLTPEIEIDILVSLKEILDKGILKHPTSDVESVDLEIVENEL